MSAVQTSPSTPEDAHGAPSEPSLSLPWSAADWWCLAIVAVVLLAPVPGLLRYQGPPMEEGFMLVFPERILAGDLPHRDFLHLYGPGSLYVLAGIYELFGGAHLYLERLVGLLQHAAVAYAMWFLLRPFGRTQATAGAVVSVVVLIGPLGLSAMAWNGALAFALVGLAALSAAGRREGRARTVLAAIGGFCGAAALLYRPDLVLAVALGLGAWWVQLREARRPLLWGFLGGIALYIPHVLLSGIGDSFQGMFVEPVFALRGGRSLPIPPSWGEVDGFLQKAGTIRVTGWPLPMLEQSQQIHLWFWLVPLSIVVVVVGAWRLRRREPHSARSLALWPAALFCAALLQQAIQRPDTAHLSWVTGVSFALCIPAVATLIEERRPATSPAVRNAWAIGAVAAVLVAVIPFYPVRTYADLVGQSLGFNRFGFPIERDGRRFPFGSAEGAEDAQRVVDALDERAEPGDSLVVGPLDLSRANYSDAFFYHLFPELDVGTRYIEMDPGLADKPDSGLAEEVAAADWLILSDAWSDWDEPNDSAGRGSDAPNRVVEEQFCSVVDAGTFRLLGRCDRVD